MTLAFQYNNEHKEATEKAYPYKGRDMTCSESSHTTDTDLLLNKGYNTVPPMNADQLKNAVSEGPVSVAVDASAWSSYRSGIFKACGTSLNHGVTLVGYTSDTWIIKNSWGASWGEQGYIRLAMGNTCGVM
jgi:C1A family cysteine protease